MSGAFFLTTQESAANYFTGEYRKVAMPPASMPYMVAGQYEVQEGKLILVWPDWWGIRRKNTSK